MLHLRPFPPALFRSGGAQRTTILLAGVGFGLLLLLRGGMLPFTYDEAYTYMHYVETGHWFDIGIANNHLLNTALMGLAAKLAPPGELTHRLPNLLFAWLGALCLGRFAMRRLQPALLFLCVLFGSFYIAEFLALARGYGLSFLCNALGMMALFSAVHRNDVRQWALANLWLAAGVFANLTSVFLYATFLGLLCVELLTRDWWPWRRRWALTTGWALGNLLLLAFFMAWALSITEAGDPLYASWSFGDGLAQTARTFFPWMLERYAVMALLAGALAAGLAWRLPFTRRLALLLAGSLLGAYCAHLITGKAGFPVNRLWVPYWPVAAFLLVEPLQEALPSATGRPWPRYALGAVSLLLLAGFWTQANIARVSDWPETNAEARQPLQALASGQCLQALGPTGLYQERILGVRAPRCEDNTPQPASP